MLLTLFPFLSLKRGLMFTVEITPSGFHVKSPTCQSRSCGGVIATIYKWANRIIVDIGSNITFQTNFDLTHTSFEVVQA